jgi:hypothetical protein
MVTGNLQAEQVRPSPSPSPSPTCMSVLHQCDLALKAEQNVNALQTQIISDEETRFAAEHKELITANVWKPIAEATSAIAIIEAIILALTHK